MTDLSPSGVAPIEPDEPFDEDAYDAMIAAMDAMIAEADTEVQEAFNANQARYPKGYKGPPGKAGQWRPKLTTGRGRVAPGHLERDIGKLGDLIAEATRNGPVVAQFDIDRIGTEVEKIALRYSARKHYEKRLKENRAEQKALRDRNWDAYEKFLYDPATTDEMTETTEVSDLLSLEDSKRMRQLADEELRLVRERDHADRDAMLGVLREIRPMGGKLNTGPPDQNTVDRSGISLQYGMAHPDRPPLEAMNADLQADLKEILKVVPKAWLDDTNSKGEVSFLFSRERAWADTQTVAPDSRDEWAGAREEFERLTNEGYEFLGRDRQYPFLALREPKSGDVIALRQDGEIVKGSWDYANTPLVLDKEGQWSLPELAERPTAEDLKRHIDPMKTLPPEHLKSGRSAMGQDWDAWKEMRDAVARYEKEGWTYVGRRGKWATLRKGDEQVSLNWAGEPLTKQVGPPDQRDLGPLNPHLTIPLPPLPSRQDTQIRIDPRPNNKNTLLHELSHRLEIVYGEQSDAGYTPISTATHAFLTRRAGNEAPRKLQDIYPGYAYEEHEMARPDEFIDAYIGKLYPDQATEVLTMGMEMLWFPRYGERDINKDPDMRRLILGMMATL
jgi:hypothetical protein